MSRIRIAFGWLGTVLTSSNNDKGQVIRVNIQRSTRVFEARKIK